MLNILIKAVFTIITKLFSLILQPILSVVLILFPDLSQIVTTIVNFFNNYVFFYISFIFLLVRLKLILSISLSLVTFSKGLVNL